MEIGALISYERCHNNIVINVIPMLHNSDASEISDD